MNFRDNWGNRVLIADDQKEIHRDFEEMLNPDLIKLSTDQLADAFGSDMNESFLPELDLLHVNTGEEAYRIVKEAKEAANPIAVAFIDVRMPPGWDGVRTTYKIREIDRDIEIVIMTAYTSKPLSDIISNIDLLHKLLYVRKPFAREEIQQMVISLVEKWNVERELAEKNRQLEHNQQLLREKLDDALAKLLGGFLPICAECKKIRDEDGIWDRIDVYIQSHTNARFTYGICPECLTRLYPELYESEAGFPVSKTEMQNPKREAPGSMP